MVDSLPEYLREFYFHLQDINNYFNINKKIDQTIIDSIMLHYIQKTKCNDGDEQIFINITDINSILPDAKLGTLNPEIANSSVLNFIEAINEIIKNNKISKDTVEELKYDFEFYQIYLCMD